MLNVGQWTSDTPDISDYLNLRYGQRQLSTSTVREIFGLSSETVGYSTTYA